MLINLQLGIELTFSLASQYEVLAAMFVTDPFLNCTASLPTWQFGKLMAA